MLVTPPARAQTPLKLIKMFVRWKSELDETSLGEDPLYTKLHSYSLLMHGISTENKATNNASACVKNSVVKKQKLSGMGKIGTIIIFTNAL